MDNRIVFVRTTKGEDEMHSRTMHLSDYIKRALMMVDGTATFGEIGKRAAPSLRAELGQMLQELEKGGYIIDKAKLGNVQKMSVPPKIATPQKLKQVGSDASDLDFMSGSSASSSSASAAEKFKREADAITKQEIEAAIKKAQQESEPILHKSAQGAANIREAAEREKQRIEAEIQAHEEAARRAKEEAEAARLRAEQANKARLEAEAKALQQIEAARKKAEQEAAIAREAAERVAREEREAAAAREEAEKQARQAAAAKTTQAPPAAHAATFAFDAFQVDEPQHFSGQHKTEQPVQKAGTAGATPAATPNTYAFDTFKIDISKPSFEPPAKEKHSPAELPYGAAKATQPPETRQPVQQDARIIAASRPAGAMPSEEDIQRETQERIAVEKRIWEESLAAKKQSEVKAKAQAEAEQRVAEAYRGEIEQAAKQTKYTVNTAPVAKPTQVARTVRRQPFSWGKLVGFMFKLAVFLLLLLLGALFVVPYVLPTRDYMPKVENLLSEKLHQPVHIGRLSGRILPLLRLELGEVYIGKQKQFQAEQVQINFAIAGLFVDAKPIDSIEFKGVKVSGAGLQSVSAWMQKLAADNQYPVARMTISQGMLDADIVQFAGVEGVLNFNPVGEFTNANLRSNAGKYMLDINAALGGKLKVAITVRDSALPLLPNWSFDELTAKGELSGNDLSISEFEGRILDGVLQGNASINWYSGWRAQGNMVAKTIAMQRLNKLLEGNVEGSARFKMTAVDMAGLADSAELDGSFMAKNGMISGMDIVTTVRSQSREHMPGGRTRFDELSGIVAYTNNTLHFKQAKITTNVLNAVTTLDINKQNLSGSMTARLSLQEGTRSANLQIGGVIDSPTLQFVP